MLSQEAKTVILQPRPAAKPDYLGSKPQPSHHNKAPYPCQRQVQLHDIEHIIACLHDLHGGSQDDNIAAADNEDHAISAPEEQPDDQPLLAHLTKRKPLPPGNIKRLLSNTSNAKPELSNQAVTWNNNKTLCEVNLKGITYCKVNNTAILYIITAPPETAPWSIGEQMEA